LATLSRGDAAVATALARVIEPENTRMRSTDLLSQLNGLNEAQLRRLLVDWSAQCGPGCMGGSA